MVEKTTADRSRSVSPSGDATRPKWLLVEQTVSLYRKSQSFRLPRPHYSIEARWQEKAPCQDKPVSSLPTSIGTREASESKSDLGLSNHSGAARPEWLSGGKSSSFRLPHPGSARSAAEARRMEAATPEKPASSLRESNGTAEESARGTDDGRRASFSGAARPKWLFGELRLPGKSSSFRLPRPGSARSAAEVRRKEAPSPGKPASSLRKSSGTAEESAPGTNKGRRASYSGAARPKWLFGQLQPSAKSKSFRVTRPCSDRPAEVLQEVAPFLELPASSLRLSRSTANLAKGHDHVLHPEQLEFVKKLGSGAFAEVELRKLRSLDGAPKEGELVAVKKLKLEMITKASEVKHFIAECAILRSLSHPNVVGCCGVGSFDLSSPEAELRSLFLVEEYIQGKTLRALLLNEELSPWRTYTYGQAVDICAGVASGLAYLHTMSPDKLIHRDIKPGNILLEERNINEEALDSSEARVGNEQDQPRDSLEKLERASSSRKLHLPGHGKRHDIEYTAKIADFGLVKAMALGEDDDDKICDSSPREGGNPSSYVYRPQKGTGRRGSLLYMAPEVYAAPWEIRRKHMYNEKVDIYALAMVMHEVFNRQAREPPPYSFRNTLLIPAELEKVAASTADGERPKIPKHWPADLKELIQESWHQEPEKRPTATDIARRLKAMRPVIVKCMDKAGLYRWLS